MGSQYPRVKCVINVSIYYRFAWLRKSKEILMANHLNPLELEAVKKLIKALNGPLELKAWIDHTKKIIQYDEILGNVEIESSLLEGKSLDADCKR